MFRPRYLFQHTGLRGYLHSDAVIAPSRVRNALHSVPKRNVGTTTTPLSAGRAASKWPRRFRSLIYAAIFAGLGYSMVDTFADRLAAPLPEPQTIEDEDIIDSLREQLDKLKIVKELRENSDYVEWEAYSNFAEEDKAHRLTSGPLKGSRGLALQRIFWNEKERKAVSVIYLGKGLDGWPTVVHGGLLSTILDESLGRVALYSFPDRTGVTANLNINYRKPVASGQFCTVTAQLDHENSSERKAIVKGQIENCEGMLCTEATALFVVPRNLALRRLGPEF